MNEPVAHFVEWTTGSARKPGKRLKLGQKLRASGPLWRVDHWLGRKWGKRAETEVKAAS